MSTLAPSRANLWYRCALSATAYRSGADIDVFPREATEDEADARREGSAAHWVAETVLRGDVPTAAAQVGKQAPNGWTITPDIATRVQGYCDYVRSFGSVTTVERAATVDVQMDDGSVRTIIRGRFDAHTTGGTDETLRLFDYKNGWKVVEADQNLPLLCYAAALWRGHEPVELHVYQPQPYHPDGKARVWRMSPAEMWAQRAELIERAANALDPEPIGNPGAHCTDCELAGACYALTQNAYAAHERIRHRALVKMNPDELANELTFLRIADKMVSTRLKAVEGEMAGRMQRGEFFRGWLRAATHGHRVLTVTPETVGIITGLDPYRKVPKTPAELEREGANPDVIAMISMQPVTGLKLQPASEKYFAKLFKRTSK